MDMVAMDDEGKQRYKDAKKEVETWPAKTRATQNFEWNIHGTQWRIEAGSVAAEIGANDKWKKND